MDLLKSVISQTKAENAEMRAKLHQEGTNFMRQSDVRALKRQKMDELENEHKSQKRQRGDIKEKEITNNSGANNKDSHRDNGEDKDEEETKGQKRRRKGEEEDDDDDDDDEPHASLADGSNLHSDLSPMEVKNRLRKMGKVATFFGESEAARLSRLQKALLDEEEGVGDDFGLTSGLFDLLSFIYLLFFKLYLRISLFGWLEKGMIFEIEC